MPIVPLLRSGCRRHGALRLALVALVLLTALATTGVALAQSSAAYDIACRGVLDSGGGRIVAPSGTFGITGSIGQTPAGVATSPNYGVRGGYIQPHSPPRIAATPATIAAGDQLTRTLLPLVGRFVRVVRGGC